MGPLENTRLHNLYAMRQPYMLVTCGRQHDEALRTDNKTVYRVLSSLLPTRVSCEFNARSESILSERFQW